MENIFSYIAANRDRYVAELLPLLRQPSISTTGEGMQDCAELVAAAMRSIGIMTQVLPTQGYPAVYGELCSPGSPRTLLLLCHYDVVPPGPLSEWRRPPFEPQVRENRIWGRGAGDAKGQLFAGLKAVEAWMAVRGELPCNVKFFFIGDEETGCPALPTTLEAYRAQLSADGVVFTDASTLDVWGPVIFLANRGVLAFELVARGSASPAHSGSYGGLLRNPALRLSQALASMRAADGRILVDGFYEYLRPLGEAEQALLANLHIDRVKKLAALGAGEFWGDPGYTYFETQMYRPTLNIHGLTAGYQDKGWMAVVPAQATAKLDINLLPDLDPDDLLRKIRRHLDRHGFADIEIVETGRLPYAESARPGDWLLRVVSQAQRRVWGVDPVLYPSIGGAGDLVKAFKEQLGIPQFVMLPLCQPDLNEHSPAESYDIDWFVKGIQTMAALFGEFSGSHG